MTVAPQRLVLVCLYVLILGSLAWFAVQGLPYYLTPLAERPRHPLYWQLKPGGSWNSIVKLSSGKIPMVPSDCCTKRKFAVPVC